MVKDFLLTTFHHVRMLEAYFLLDFFFSIVSLSVCMCVDAAVNLWPIGPCLWCDQAHTLSVVCRN